MLFSLLLACTGATDTDSAKETGTTDSDTEETTETGTTTSGGATVSGTVLAPDGTPLANGNVQLCDIQCYIATSGSDGSFSFAGTPAGSYKLDVLGELQGYGHARAPVVVEEGVDQTLPWNIQVFEAGPGATLSGSDSYVFGDVIWTVDSANIELPLGYDSYDFNVNVIDGAAIPAYWDVSPAFALSFLPWDAEPTAAFDIGVSGQAEVPYTVYAIGLHGDLEEVGTAAGAGGIVAAAGLQPTNLTWLVYVAQ